MVLVIIDKYAIHTINSLLISLRILVKMILGEYINKQAIKNYKFILKIINLVKCHEHKASVL